MNTASAVINEVCNAIVLYVGPKYLHLLKTDQEVKEKISEFETKFGMIQAFGCIDGNHIPIACASKHSHEHFCYKQFHLLSLQAVCDYKRAFMDVECKWPGSVHDVKVFAKYPTHRPLSTYPSTHRPLTHRPVVINLH